jgi:Ca2+-binding EF-hand superfamily protein
MKSHFGRGSVLRLGTLLCASWLRTCEGFAPALDGLLLRRTCSSSSIRHHPTSPQRMSEEAGGSTKSGILRRTCGSSSIDHERRRTTTSLRMSEGEGDKAFPLSKSSSVDKMLGTNKPEEMFALTDSDGSGGLDFDEFSSVFGGLGLGMGYAEMRELFEKIDLNKDGVISLSEFSECVRMQQSAFKGGGGGKQVC